MRERERCTYHSNKMLIHVNITTVTYSNAAISPATILNYYWRTNKVMSIICEHGSHIMALYFQNSWSSLHLLFRNVTLSYPLLHLCKSLVRLGGIIEVSFLLCLSKSHLVKRSKHVADVKRVCDVKEFSRGLPCSGLSPLKPHHPADIRAGFIEY